MTARGKVERIEWARWVRKHRDKLGLSGRALARLAELDPSYISHMEREGWVPSLQAVESVAKALGADLASAYKAAGFNVRPC